MGAILTATVRAPLTAIVLMIELTGQYDFMLPLLVACFAAYGVAEALGDRPIYEALRERSAPRGRGD
jgi:CIC family chloride channel protein